MSPVALEYARQLLQGNPVSSDQEIEADDEFIRREVEEIVQAALHECGFHELRRIEVFSLEGNVSLHGTVSNYYLKQVAQTVANRQTGVSTVANRIRVARSVLSGATG